MSNISKERLEQVKRIKQLREMTGLSRRDFSKKAGIPHSSLQYWENPEETEYKITLDAAQRLLIALRNFGVQCSEEWIQTGEGPSPYIINAIAIERSVLKEKTAKLDIGEGAENKDIEQELNLFLQKNKDAVATIIFDDAMSPRYIIGEVVAGIRVYETEMEKIAGWDCIVLTQDGDIYVRTLMKGSLTDHYNLIPCNPNTAALKAILKDVKLVSAAPIIWTRRKHPLT